MSFSEVKELEERGKIMMMGCCLQGWTYSISLHCIMSYLAFRLLSVLK